MGKQSESKRRVGRGAATGSPLKYGSLPYTRALDERLHRLPLALGDGGKPRHHLRRLIRPIGCAIHSPPSPTQRSRTMHRLRVWRPERLRSVGEKTKSFQRFLSSNCITLLEDSNLGLNPKP